MRGEAGSTSRSPLAAYLVSFVVVGISMSMVGPAMTHLRDRAGVSIGAGGVLLAGQGIGYVGASLLVGHRLDRGGGHRILLGAAAGSASTATVLLGVRELWLVAVVFTVLGACGGAVDVTANTLLVWHEHPTKVGPALNALHLCFGLGAIGAPLVVAASLTWRGDLSLVAATLAALVVVIGVLLRPCPTPARRRHDDVVVTLTRHRRRILLLAGAFFVVYVGSEGTFGAWCATYGEGLGMTGSAGPAMLTAVFWGGFSLGRVTAIVATRRGSVERVLVASCGAAAAAALLLTAGDGSTAVAWVVTAVLGFTLGPQYATMLAATDRRIRLDGRSTSRLIGAAGVGGLVLPMATGWLLDRLGADALPAIVAVGAAATLVLVLALVADRHPPHTAAQPPLGEGALPPAATAPTAGPFP